MSNFQLHSVLETQILIMVVLGKSDISLNFLIIKSTRKDIRCLAIHLSNMGLNPMHKELNWGNLDLNHSLVDFFFARFFFL